jgi:hypothetical protein
MQFFGKTLLSNSTSIETFKIENLSEKGTTYRISGQASYGNFDVLVTLSKDGQNIVKRNWDKNTKNAINKDLDVNLSKLPKSWYYVEATGIPGSSYYSSLSASFSTVKITNPKDAQNVDAKLNRIKEIDETVKNANAFSGESNHLLVQERGKLYSEIGNITKKYRVGGNSPTDYFSSKRKDGDYPMKCFVIYAGEDVIKQIFYSGLKKEPVSERQKVGSKN